MPPTVKASEILSQAKSKREVNLTLRILERARADTLKPTLINITKFEENEIKLAKRRKTIPVIDIIERPEIAIKIENNPKEDKIRRVLEDISTEKTSGKFPTDRDFLISQIGFNELDDKLNVLQEWQLTNKDASIMWRENYLKAIDNAMEVALISYDSRTYDSLQKLREYISTMDLVTFLVGQLAIPEQLGIDYVYPVKGETSPWAERIDRVISEWENIIG